jgi:hypothetical protein
MSRNPFLRNDTRIYSNPYTPGGYEKAKLRKLLLTTVGVVAAIVIIGLILYLLPPSQQSKYTKSATAAARKVTPHAKVTNIKVAGSFASARVNDPTASGQAKAGNITIFKVSTDGSMTQIANGSSFTPLDLLGLGIPLTTQAELTNTSVAQVKQTLANSCGYSGGNTPGFSSFIGSFNPDGWQISATTLDGLKQVLTTVINDKNITLASDKTIICVNATQNGSNRITDMKTYISTFTLQVQFITRNGTLTKHTVTYAVGPKYYRRYSLDGNDISTLD